MADGIGAEMAEDIAFYTKVGPELIRSFSCLRRFEYEDVAPEIRAGDLNVVWRILFDGAAVICDRVCAGFVDSYADLCEGGGQQFGVCN